jgi:hypothetical protein
MFQTWINIAPLLIKCHEELELDIHGNRNAFKCPRVCFPARHDSMVCESNSIPEILNSTIAQEGLNCNADHMK